MILARLFRAGIFILAFLIGMLRGSVAYGKEAWALKHEAEGIREYQLNNGLKVLLFPDQSKSTITVNVTYFVGSRHEGYGEAGMAHLLEHMLFRGTYTRGNIMKLLEEKGGNFNGTTWFDRTNYFETLPASKENLEFALALEADRMVNSKIAADDLAKEFSVVRNEFEMDENSNQGALSDQMLGVAYQWHGYGRSTIGNKSDIEKVPADRLREFYQRYYQPDNAMIVVAGTFDEPLAKALIEKHFGGLAKPKRSLNPTYTIEPVQEGARQISLHRHADQAIVGLMYHAVPGAHPEFSGIEALVNILTDQPSGLLYRELVKKGLAAEVEGTVWSLTEPGVISFFAKVAKGQDAEKLAKRMIELLEHLKPEQVSATELARYQQHYARNFTLSWSDSTWSAVELSEWAALGDWRLMFQHRDSVQALKMEQALAGRRYLLASNRTLGYFLPTSKIEKAPEISPIEIAESIRSYESTRSIEQGETFDATWPNIQQRLQSFTLSNGLKVAILAKQGRGSPVSMLLDMSLHNDSVLKSQKQALRLLPDLMLRGTKTMDQGAFEDALALHKAHIEGHSEWNIQDPGELRLSAVTVGEHSSEVLRLMLEAFRFPRFDPQDFPVVKAEILAGLKDESQDPSSLAWREYLRLMTPYPDDDPRSIPSLETEYQQIEKINLEQIKKTQASLLQYAKAHLVIIGAVDPQVVRAELEKLLADWKPKPNTDFKKVEWFEPKGGHKILNTPDKKGAQIFAGIPLRLSDEDPDYPALKMAGIIWGGTMSSRLVQRLRHQDGLSYGAGGGFSPGIGFAFGTFSSFAICAPQNLAKALKGLQEELSRLIKLGVSSQELQEARNAYQAQKKSVLSDDAFLTELILKNLRIERSLDFEVNFDSKMQGLKEDDIQRALGKWIKPEQIQFIQALDEAAAGKSS